MKTYNETKDINVMSKKMQRLCNGELYVSNGKRKKSGGGGLQCSLKSCVVISNFLKMCANLKSYFESKFY